MGILNSNFLTDNKMEKIKASEILKTNPQLNMSQLKLYRFFAVDEDFDMTIFKESPIRVDDGIYGGSWKSKDDNYLCINGACSGWQNSLREIDFDNELDPNQEIEIKGVRFNLTIEEVKALQRKLITILCNDEKEVELVKDCLKEFEESDREFPDELFTPKSQTKDEENNN